MKKIISVIISLSISVLLCGGACTDKTRTSEQSETPGGPIAISDADELANYIRYYYNRGIPEDTQEYHYLFDGNYKLTQSYSKYSGNILIPEYPGDVTAEALPYSATFINNNGDFYARYVNTSYGADISAGYYFQEEQSQEVYYKADTVTGYAIVTIDNKNFDIYPEFEERERVFENRNYWEFATAEEFDSAKNDASGAINGFLGIEIMIDLFKVDILSWDDPIPHIDGNDFEKLVISQNGNVVSFEIVYGDEYITSAAEGTLNVAELEFRFTYSEIRREESGTIEREYNFELVSLADGYQIEFDTSGRFEESSDYIYIP